jgi:hypothetical protein
VKLLLSVFLPVDTNPHTISHPFANTKLVEDVDGRFDADSAMLTSVFWDTSEAIPTHDLFAGRGVVAVDIILNESWSNLIMANHLARLQTVNQSGGRIARPRRLVPRLQKQSRSVS